MVRIACVGITVMDRIYYVEGLPTEGGRCGEALYGSGRRACGDRCRGCGEIGRAGGLYWPCGR